MKSVDTIKLIVLTVSDKLFQAPSDALSRSECCINQTIKPYRLALFDLPLLPASPKRGFFFHRLHFLSFQNIEGTVDFILCVDVSEAT